MKGIEVRAVRERKKENGRKKDLPKPESRLIEIGRASCRERV